MLRARRRFLLAVLATLLVAGACAQAASFEVERIQRADVKVLPGREGFVNPLTGIVSYTPQPWQNRPVLGIKVGNSAAERPQAGIDKADVVYEEIVEGGVTRFLALFLTNEAARVGPVRSVRTVDPVIMEPFRGLFGYSGGVPPVVSALQSSPTIDVGANRRGDAYRRDDSRDAPNNLYTSTNALWEGRTGSPPPPQFEFLSTADDPTEGGDEEANEVRLSFAGNGALVRYTYDAKTGRYERFTGETPHLVEGTPNHVQLAFRNVLVQVVTIRGGSTVDQAGLRSSDIDVTGSGSAVLFRGGRALRGQWSRESASDPTTFTDDAGEPLRLAPGETLIELLPRGREIFVD